MGGVSFGDWILCQEQQMRVLVRHRNPTLKDLLKDLDDAMDELNSAYKWSRD
jgi:hypothetical protein